MYTTIKYLHSLWAYLVVIMVFIAVTNAIFGLMGKRSFTIRDLRISLFALIVTHLQIVIGLVLFFVSPMVQWFNSNADKSLIMKDSQLRLINMEHPLMMIIGIILITIGFSKQKKKIAPNAKFKTILIFYGIGFILILMRIPWDLWF